MERKIIRNKRKFSELQAYSRQEQAEKEPLFPEAEEFPSFFEDNLVDEDRTIKLFHQHPYTHETIFYFQLLRLIFETEDSDYQVYLQKIYNLLDNPEFQLIMPDYNSPYYLPIRDANLKRMLYEFLEELGEGNYTVYQLLSKYPIMDKILVLFLRTILIMGEQCQNYEDEIDPVQLYQFLSEYFQIDLTYYTNCLKFNLSDLFVYFQAENEIYMAYITTPSSQQQLPSSNDYYNPDPEEAFNISSVHQMVSEIDIPVEEDCFLVSNKHHSFNEISEVQYEYSQSQEMRRPSRSIQQNSDIKLSYLIPEDSLQSLNVVKSNKILQKQVLVDRKNYVKPIFKQQECFSIEQAPPQLQNALSPIATPKEMRFVTSESDDTEQNFFQKQNIYSKFSKDDRVKQYYQDFIETGFTEKGFISKEKRDSWEEFKKETDKVLTDNQLEEEQMEEKEQKQEQEPSKIQKTMKSLYEMRSIKTIVSCNDSQSCVADTPFKGSFNPSFQPSFQPSFHQSRKQTATRLIPPVFKKNEYTKFGYVNNNLSNEFTSSLLLKQMNEPFRSSIESLKTRARKERTNIQNMIRF